MNCRKCIEMNKFLIVGFGGAGQRIMGIIERILPKCDVAIWNTGRTPVLLSNNITKITNFDEAIVFNPEGVFIATPTSTHLRYSEAFLGKVKFILIDKPLDSTLNQCEVFARNCRLSETNVYLNFQRRFLPCWQTLRNFINENCDGKFLYGSVSIGSYYPEWRPHKKASELYAARKDLGGGVLLTECHELDLLQWVLKSQVTRVCAKFLCAEGENSTENNAQLLLNMEMPYGARTVSVTLDYLSPVNMRKMELHFESATYVIDEILGTVTKVTTGDSRETIGEFKQELGTPHELLLQTLLKQEYEDNNEHDLPCLDEGLRVNAIIHAAKISQKNNSWETVVNSVCPSEGMPYLEIAIQKLQDVFNGRLIAIYGVGSLGYGGYVDGWSDFDLDVLIETTYDNAKTDYQSGKAIEEEIQKMGFERIDIRVYSPKHLNERNTVLTYGQSSRALMICDTATLLAGRDIRSEINRPSRQDMNKEAQSLLTNMLAKQKEWWDTLPWDDIAAHFALAARFLYTKDTGEVADKRLALEYFLNNIVSEFSNEILRWVLWALACRVGRHPLLIQNILHEEAIQALKLLFEKTLTILEQEVC